MLSGRTGAAHYTKTEVVVAADGVVPVAVGGTQLVCIVVPGPAANNAYMTIVTAFLADVTLAPALLVWVARRSPASEATLERRDAETPASAH